MLALYISANHRYVDVLDILKVTLCKEYNKGRMGQINPRLCPRRPEFVSCVKPEVNIDFRLVMLLVILLVTLHNKHIIMLVEQVVLLLFFRR